MDGEAVVQIQADTSVSELIKTYPAVIPVFLQHQMACVGCGMSAFETVGDAARIYGIKAEDFLAKLRAVITD